MSKPRLSRLMPILVAVRRSIETQFPRRKTCRNLCSFSACAVEIIAAKNGIRLQIMGGEYRPTALINRPQFGNRDHIAASRSKIENASHAWIRYQRNYIDLTLTQFDSAAPPIAILPETDKRYCGTAIDPWVARMNLEFCGYSPDELESVVKRAERLLREAARKTDGAVEHVREGGK